MITKNMKIYDIVKKYPQLMDVLVEQSPKFVKLKNKVLFNTMAKIATIEDAANIGKIPVEQLVHSLNQSINPTHTVNDKDPRVEKVKQEKSAQEQGTGEVIKWGAGSDPDNQRDFNHDNFPVVDVRKIEDPFQDIMNVVKQIKHGEGFWLIQSFEPIPLYKVMETKGFSYTTHKKSEEEYHVLFSKKQ